MHRQMRKHLNQKTLVSQLGLKHGAVHFHVMPSIEMLLCSLQYLVSQTSYLLFLHCLFTTLKSNLPLFLFPLITVAELRVQVFQAALKTHDIDTDSATGVSIITDDRSSCRFTDNEEVSECV